MVSKFATGYSTDARGRPFRRRNYRPAIVIASVLAVLALAAWIFTVVSQRSEAAPIDCNMPTAKGAPDLKPAARNDMLSVSPAALPSFQVEVVNSAAARGQARSVSDDLTGQGFSPGDPAYGDDPVYPDRDLHCVAQIRFGPATQAAAAAVWLAQPCAQLVNDGRSGTQVTLALGEYYTGGHPSQDVQAAVEALRAVDPRNPKSGVDRSLIEAVHNQKC
ncbi:MAG: envelope integrity protein Cei [Gordonia sp. (in: high G+C Gram-positive bacteria)]|uniref:envelope integrity protein Cei n=1 Tax=Gordonia sp. (in: high G+C Gram-positive bacteria) TaxID=84139 RepID=UPI0039E53A01